MPTPDTRRVGGKTRSARSLTPCAVSDSRSRNECRPPARVRARRLIGRALFTPDAGLLAQGARFVIAGGTVAAVYVGTTTLLANVAGVPFQGALAIGFCVALTVHFTLQRLFVWTRHEEFALPLHHQVGRYLTVAAAQYGVTVASTSLLPSALNVSAEAVYLATVAVVYSMNFVVFRQGIFHAEPAVPARDREAPASAGDDPGAPSSRSRGAE